MEQVLLFDMAGSTYMCMLGEHEEQIEEYYRHGNQGPWLRVHREDAAKGESGRCRGDTISMLHFGIRSTATISCCGAGVRMWRADLTEDRAGRASAQGCRGAEDGLLDGAGAGGVRGGQAGDRQGARPQQSDAQVLPLVSVRAPLRASPPPHFFSCLASDPLEPPIHVSHPLATTRWGRGAVEARGRGRGEVTGGRQDVLWHDVRCKLVVVAHARLRQSQVLGRSTVCPPPQPHVAWAARQRWGSVGEDVRAGWGAEG